MKITTLCYIQNNGHWLMMHRNKKAGDPNEGKWIGVGGKLETGESPEECIIREIQEETCLPISNLRYRGHVTFCSDIYPDELIFVYTAHTPRMTPCTTSEGTFKWVPLSEVLNLNLWEGDTVFLTKLMEIETRGTLDVFTLKLTYQGNTLVSAQ